jgi:hypothetical protein
MQTMTLPPIPPSDNLYKFAAIGGLILVVLSLYIPWKLGLDLVLASYDLDLDIQKARVESDQINNELMQNTENFQSLCARERATEFLKSIDSKNTNLPDEESKQYAEGHNGEVQKKILEQRLMLEKLKNTVAKQKYISSQTIVLVFFSIGMLLIGLTLTYLGFRDWYFKFQRYQDHIVKAQAEQWTTARPENDRDEIPG